MRVLRFVPSLLLALALLTWAAPASAQPPRSDNAGPIITGGEVAGRGYPGAGFRAPRDAIFRRAEGTTVFRNRGVADAVLGEAATGGQAICDGSLQPPAWWPEGVAFDSVAERTVCGVLQEPDLPAREALRCALIGGLPGEHVAAAEALVSSLDGLFRTEMRFLDSRERWVLGAAWGRAFVAYDVYLSAAPDALLDVPPHELVVLGTVLQRMVDAGLRASGR